MIIGILQSIWKATGRDPWKRPLIPLPCLESSSYEYVEKSPKLAHLKWCPTLAIVPDYQETVPYIGLILAVMSYDPKPYTPDENT